MISERRLSMLPTALSTLASQLRSIPDEEVSYGVVIAELAIAFVLLVSMLFFRQRVIKILCACGTEVCLFLACKLFFGSDSIVTQVMCWFTAAVACIITVVIVNRINWANLRGKNGS
jgi:hypothetical protein